MERPGCPHCWPEDPMAASRATADHERLATPIDESHFIVTVLACRACGQGFVSMFTETVDWADGDDPQHRVVMPITGAEADRLRSTPVTESDLNALPERTVLVVDHPKGAPPAVRWGVGLIVPHHD